MFGEVVIAFISYPIILLAPGLLWTFLFRSINSNLVVIKRLLISVAISISSIPLLLFLINRYLCIHIDSTSIVLMLALVTFIPFLISFMLTSCLHKQAVLKPSEIIRELKEFLKFTFIEIKKVAKSKSIFVLTGITIMGITLTLLPHIGYSLPIHTDEWHYAAYADNLISLKSTELEMPYYGWDQGEHWEVGFIIFIAMVKILSGISWPFIFSTLPAVIFSLIILTSYKIGQKYDFGLHSAFIVALTPSTLRFLGPVFLVPLTLGIFFILITIYLLIAHSNVLRYPLVFLLLSFTFLMHPPSGGYLFISIFAVLLINIMKKQKKDSLYIGCILLVFIIGAFILPESVLRGSSWSSLTASSNFFLPLFGFNDFMDLVGYIPPFLAIIGLVYLFQRREKYSQSLLAIFTIFALFVASLYYIFTNFFSIQAVFDRAIMVLAVMVALIGGSGLMMVQKNVSKPLFIVLLSCVLLLSLSAHAKEPYYHIISENEYDDFIWIHDNLNSSYEKAILDPWKAVAFTPVTGKNVFYRIPQGPSSDMEANINSINTFFAGYCSDSDFLESNGITIVYTLGNCSNPDLVEVRDNVYIYHPTDQ